jgi:hypothetical protein
MDAPPLTFSLLVRPERSRPIDCPRSPFLLPLPCVFVSASSPHFLFRHCPSPLSSVFVPGFRSHFLKKSKSGVRGLHRDRQYCYGFPRASRRQRGGFGVEHQHRPYVMTVALSGVCFSRTILPADGLPSHDEVLNVAGDGTCLRWSSPHVNNGSIFFSKRFLH